MTAATHGSPSSTSTAQRSSGSAHSKSPREPFVNTGNLDHKVRIIGVGRVGGPAAMIVSDDLGKSWQQVDINAHAAMAFNVHFFDRNHGIIAAASDTDVARSHARIITTFDGGKTWTTAYESKRPYELTWKISFPTPDVGYVTVQSYAPDPAATGRFVVKTVDGGRSWTEIPLSSDPKVRQFGVAFIDENRGWIGATPAGFQTVDGGKTRTSANSGNAVNRIRIIRYPEGTSAFAIGVSVYRAIIEGSKQSVERSGNGLGADQVLREKSGASLPDGLDAGSALRVGPLKLRWVAQRTEQV